MEWTDQALVLRMGAFRESDLWLKLLCREHGLLTLFAFGGSRSRRRFCGCLDVLNSLQCRVRSSKDGRFLNLEEAALLQGPRLLRRNWQRMGLAANCLRFVEAMGVGEDAATEAFLLVEDLRAVLEAEKAPPVLLPLYFRLRLAGALGFAPNLGQCGRCGRTRSSWSMKANCAVAPVAAAASNWSVMAWRSPHRGLTFCAMYSKVSRPGGRTASCRPRCGGPVPGPSMVLSSTIWGWPGKGTIFVGFKSARPVCGTKDERRGRVGLAAP